MLRLEPVNLLVILKRKKELTNMYKMKTIIILCMLLFLTVVGNAAEQQSNLSPANQQSGKQFVLLIGINEYHYLPYLKAPVNNTTLMAEALSDGNQQNEIITLTNANASKRNIIDALHRINEKIEKKDSLLIYYSGHGGQNTLRLQSKLRPTMGTNDIFGGNIFDETIMPVDASYRTETQITFVDLKELLRNLPTAAVTVIIDNCYSHTMVQSIAPSFNSVNAVRRPRTSMRDLNILGYNVLVANDWNEGAWEDYFTGRPYGIFTHFLAQGLTTHIDDTNNNGSITSNELFNYARTHTLQYGGIQHPQIYKGRNAEQILLTYK